MNILDIVFPKVCSGCGREGGYICDYCLSRLIKPTPICPECCKPSLDGMTHARCRRRYGMDGLWVGLPYKGVVQQCLKKVKYKSAWDIISFLYDLCQFRSVNDSIVTSVPMWSTKVRERGFNQADIIATLMTSSLSGDSRKVELLERVRETKPQFGLNKKQRISNMEGAFRMNPKSQILKFSNGSKVILIDDVWTTGATMRECARVLKQAGVMEVWGLTLAR